MEKSTSTSTTTKQNSKTGELTPTKVRTRMQYVVEMIHLGHCVCDVCNPDRKHDDC